MRPLHSLLLAVSLATLAAACGNEDPDPQSGSAGSGGSGLAGSGSSGSGTAGSGTAGSGSCVDPKTETSVVPATAADGSGPWTVDVEGGDLVTSDLDGIYTQPLAGGTRTTLVTLSLGTPVLRVTPTVVQFVKGLGGVRTVPRTGGSETSLVDLPSGHVAAALTDDLVVSHLISPSDPQTRELYATPLPGGTPAMLASFTSMMSPLGFRVVGDKVFFVIAPASFNEKQLVSVPLTGGVPSTVALPSGLKLARMLGAVGDAVLVSAEDDFLKQTILRIDGSGAVTASYVATGGTALAAVAVPGGVAIGGVSYLDHWKDGDAAATRVRCFTVAGAIGTESLATMQGYAASGSDVFASLRTQTPAENAVVKLALP